MPIIEFIPTYNYFNKFIAINAATNVLDFGSNCGANVLKSGYIKPEIYTGVDVDIEAINHGESLYPAATWIHYNRFNPAYNASGDNSLPILTESYDLIISYSVFSHLPINDVNEILDYLYSHLLPGGTICFSYCNIEHNDCKEWFRSKRTDCDIIPIQDYIYLVDNKTTDAVPLNCSHFVSFYHKDFLIRELSRFNPTFFKSPNGWLQDSCIIKK